MLILFLGVPRPTLSQLPVRLTRFLLASSNVVDYAQPVTGLHEERPNASPVVPALAHLQGVAFAFDAHTTGPVT